MARACLVIADMINDFVRPDGALPCRGALEILPRVRRLLEEFRLRGDGVIFLADNHDPDDREFTLYPPHGVAGTAGSRVVDELKPRTGEPVLPKKFFSGARGTALLDVLRRHPCDEVHLAGVCTSICIMETASDLVESDFAVVVHADAVADFDPEMHDCAIKRMERVLQVSVVGK